MPLEINDILAQKILEYAQSKQQSVEQVLAEWLNQANAVPDQLRTLFDVLPVGVAVLNKDWQITQVNPALQTILGMSEEDLRGSKYTTRQYIHPDATPMSLEEFPSRRAVLEQKAFFDVEIGVIREDGIVVWTSVNAAPLPNQMGAVTVTTDITTKRHAEVELRLYQNYLEDLVAERTRELELANSKLQQEINEREVVQLALLAEKQQSESILNHMADNVVLTDIQGTIIYVNPAWELATGYSLADVHGKNIRVLQSGQTPRERYTQMWHTIFHGHVWSGELINRRQDGKIFHSHETIVPVKNGRGEIIYFVGVSRDITQERQLAKMKEEFIANVAHDLNNPITVLKAGLYLLKYDPSQLEERITVFEEQTNRLQALVDDLLTISRLDRGTFVPELQPMDGNQLIAQVIMAQTSLAQQKQIELIFEPNSRVPLLMADRNLLERVMVNLVANAINYTLLQGTVRVSLDMDSKQAVIIIEDTGIGIADEDLPYIFDRFFRSNLARQTAPGTGLGLSIVKDVVELHHGKIEVMSKVGTGTQFRVYMPLAQVSSSAPR